MSDERMLTGAARGGRAERPATTVVAAHDDHEVEGDDEQRTKIAPADLAMARAIIDAALARRS